MENDYSFGVIPYFQKHGEIRFLLIQHQAGHWSFPKGHRESTETDIQAATRELYEETGLTLVELDESLPFLEHYTCNLDSKILNKSVTYFLGKVSDTSVIIQPKEVQAYAWLNYQEAIQSITYPEAKAVLKAANNYLKK